MSFFVAAKECQLPKNIVNWRIFIVLDQFYSPSNPKAGQVMLLQFSDDVIEHITLRNNRYSEGEYQYKLLAPDVALLSYQLNRGEEWTISKLLLACDSDRKGKFIYSQSQGSVKPNVRQNTGNYIITNIE